jgi:hypothetical protein
MQEVCILVVFYKTSKTEKCTRPKPCMLLCLQPWISAVQAVVSPCSIEVLWYWVLPLSQSDMRISCKGVLLCNLALNGFLNLPCQTSEVEKVRMGEGQRVTQKRTVSPSLIILPRRIT